MPNGTATLNFSNYTSNLHLIIEIEDIYGNIVFAPTIINISDREAHNIAIPTSGNYYIRISTNEVSFDTPISYRIVIGEPFYTTSSYTYNFNNTFTISSSNPTVTSTFSTANIASIPKDAIIYRVAIGGTQTNRASGQIRSIKVSGTSYWINCPEYIFENDNLVHLGIKARNNWDFKLTASTFPSSSYSLKPSIRISYVYPES